MRTDRNAIILAAIDAARDPATGRTTPEALRDAARDPLHPLHNEFEWDNVVAGDAHRLEQARALIRSVRVDIRVEERVVRSVAYVKDPDSEPRESGYLRLTDIRRQSEQARDVVRAELARVASSLSRARIVADVLGLSGELDALLDEVAGLRQDIEDPDLVTKAVVAATATKKARGGSKKPRPRAR